MTLYGFDAYAPDSVFEECGMIRCNSVKEVVAQADFINVGVPLTEETRNMLDVEVINCMKPNAVLINSARGGIVNEDDLYEALLNNTIRAAACDVFASEPVSETHRLLTLPNFIATPHIAGSTEEALYRMGTSSVKDLLRVLNGEKPEYQVR